MEETTSANCWVGCIDIAKDRRKVSSHCCCSRKCSSIVFVGIFAWFLNTVTLAADWYKYYSVVLLDDYGIFVSKEERINVLIYAFCIIGSILYLLSFFLVILQGCKSCCNKSKGTSFRVADEHNPLPPPNQTAEGVFFVLRITIQFLVIFLEDIPMSVTYYNNIVPCTLYWTDWIHLGALAASVASIFFKIIIVMFLMACTCSSPYSGADSKKKGKKKARMRVDTTEEEYMEGARGDGTSGNSNYYTCSSMSLGVVSFMYICVAAVALVYSSLVLSDALPQYLNVDWWQVDQDDNSEIYISTFMDFNGSIVYTSRTSEFYGDTSSSPVALSLIDARDITSKIDESVTVQCSDLVVITDRFAGEIACTPIDCKIEIVFGYRKTQPNSIVYDYEEDNTWFCVSNSVQNMTMSQKFKDYRYDSRNIVNVDFLPTAFNSCLRPQRDTSLIPEI